MIDQGKIVALGTLDEMLGSAGVRVRVEMTAPPIDAVVRAFDSAASFGADGWCTLQGLRDGAVPDLVARLVQAGARVLAVEPARVTLEERFLDLLEG
jgi:ABC-2 type transport system ATP-binding protein